MGTFLEHKTSILNIMANTYTSKGVAPKNVGSKVVEEQGFVLDNHAVAIQKVCSAKGVMVSFRQTGVLSLNRIKEKYPCKGHNILNKSIKPKDSAYTYAIDEKTFEKYKGFVGYSDNKNNDRKLLGLWVCENNKPLKKPLAEVKDFDKKYTGDYDMEDLLHKDKEGKYQRVLATTPEEKVLIDALNACTSRGLGQTPKDKRSTANEYSVIRHGAQTSFISYLLSNIGSKELAGEVQKDSDSIPFQGSVVTVSSPICVFDGEGIYILSNVNEIYQFYKSRDLLNEIPFYYFLDDLAKKYPYTEKNNNTAEAIEIHNCIVDFKKWFNNFVKNYK